MKVKTILGIIAMLIACSIQTVFSQATFWELGGNSITDPLDDYIGTTNSEPFVIRTNDDPQMIIDATGDVFMGVTNPVTLDVDGNINVSGEYRIGGENVLGHNGDPSNIFVGEGAGANVNGSQANTFVGNEAGYNQSTTDGGENVFIGSISGKASTISKLNAYVGVGSGQFNEEGIGNSIVGYLAGRFNLVSYNSFFGLRSGQLTNNGGYNSFFGAHSGYSNTTGSENVFIGSGAGYHTQNTVGNTTGFNNVFLGFESGWTNTEGNNNTYLGHSARGTGTDGAILEFASAIGANAQVTANNCMVLGGIGAFAVNVGIGLTAPAYTLDVNGTVAAKKILITTENETQDLLALIMQLQQELEILKKELNLIAER